MARGVARYLVGSFVVLGLAACGKMMFAERDAWRHEAEIACLKTGQVKESASLARIQPITGPGICGADFPLKVAAIGEGSAIGFADELRPPGGIPGAVARQPLADAPYTPRVSAPPYQAYPQQPYPQQQYQQPHQAQPPYQAQRPQAGPAPMSIYAPGVAQPDPEGAEDDTEEFDQAQPAQRAPAYGTPPRYPPAPRAPRSGATLSANHSGAAISAGRAGAARARARSRHDRRRQRAAGRDARVPDRVGARHLVRERRAARRDEVARRAGRRDPADFSLLVPRHERAARARKSPSMRSAMRSISRHSRSQTAARSP